VAIGLKTGSCMLDMRKIFLWLTSGKSLTQFEESPWMAVSKDKETVTKQLLLTSDLPNLWVIRISHFLYLS